jgi:acetamidase/formamidase
MLGPVEVTGAQPGDVIEVSISALRTIGWGWNSFPLYEHGIMLPMAPFLGVVAAEPAGQEPACWMAPRAGTPAARHFAPRSGRYGPPRDRPPCI